MSLDVGKYMGRGTHYTVRCKCSNCGHEGGLTLPKGHHAPQGGLGGTKETCPHCGCRTYTRRL